MVLRMCLRMGENLGPAREKVGVRLAGPRTEAHDHGPRASSCNCSPTGLCGPRARLRTKPASSAGVINGLIDEGALETLVLPPEPVARQPDPDHAVAGASPTRNAPPPMPCVRRWQRAASP